MVNFFKYHTKFKILQIIKSNFDHERKCYFLDLFTKWFFILCHAHNIKLKHTKHSKQFFLTTAQMGKLSTEKLDVKTQDLTVNKQWNQIQNRELSNSNSLLFLLYHVRNSRHAKLQDTQGNY